MVGNRAEHNDKMDNFQGSDEINIEKKSFI